MAALNAPECTAPWSWPARLTEERWVSCTLTMYTALMDETAVEAVGMTAAIVCAVVVAPVTLLVVTVVVVVAPVALLVVALVAVEVA